MPPFTAPKIRPRKMVKSGPSRRLIVGLAFLLIIAQSSPFSAYFYTSTSSPVSDSISTPLASSGMSKIQSHSAPVDFVEPEPEVVWFSSVNNSCMGIHGFSHCGDTNAWTIIRRQDDASFMLMPYLDLGFQITPQRHDEHLCLSSTSIFDHSPTLTTFCSNFYDKLTSWTFDAASGKLSINIINHDTFDADHYCINQSSEGKLSLTRCEDSYVKLISVRYPKPVRPIKQTNPNLSQLSSTSTPKIDRQEHNSKFSIDSSPGLITAGTWVCPKTGLAFPRNLNDVLKDNKNQLLMGGGLFQKTMFNINFNVYTVAWYVDVDAMRSDPLMQSFAGQSAAALSSNPRFYEAISSPGNYDRTLYIKLAMKLKCEMMVQGLIDDLLVKEDNKQSIASTARLYPQVDCKRGLDMLFTWRHPQPSTNFRNTLEIRVDGQLLSTLSAADEGQDLLTQFVVPDPVAPVAKIAFAENFPQALAPTSTTTTTTTTTNPGSNKIKASGSSASSSSLPDIPRVFNMAGKVMSAVAMMS